MSRTAVLGSNALATAVQFYAAALDEATRRADQAETMLKQLAARVEQASASGEVERLVDEIDNEFIEYVINEVEGSSLGENPIAKLSRIREAIGKRYERRRQPAPGSPTIDRNLVTSDDAPRGGEVREADVPR